MVRAILNGTKSQTRRIVKGQDTSDPYEFAEALNSLTCPYGQRGDRLWVRETFGVIGDEEKHVLHYRATHHRDGPGMGWRPSIHVPRWASRITLEITNVRVERLQEITHEDALAEGVDAWIQSLTDSTSELRKQPLTLKQLAFSRLWDSVAGSPKFDWDANPWVWIVEFKKIGGAE